MTTSNGTKLRRDIREILKLNESGGSMMTRDDNTIIVSCVSQISHNNVNLLMSVHPYLHITYAGEYNSVDSDSFVVIITILPYTTMLLSMHTLELMISTSWLLVSMLTLFIYTQEI